MLTVPANRTYRRLFSRRRSRFWGPDRHRGVRCSICQEKAAEHSSAMIKAFEAPD